MTVATRTDQSNLYAFLTHPPSDLVCTICSRPAFPSLTLSFHLRSFRLLSVPRFCYLGIWTLNYAIVPLREYESTFSPTRYLVQSLCLMSSSCLSAATIVRCVALTRLQHGIVFVPAAVQIIFLALLTAVYWSSGRRVKFSSYELLPEEDWEELGAGLRRRHLMVVADGSAFYIVAFLDFLSHIIPVARNHLRTFKIFDIVIGVLSFVPILFFTAFLYLFSRSYFIPTLPKIPHAIAKYALLALIPVTVGMNELASFLGISYRVFQNRQGQSYLAIGFATGKDETLWQFLTSMTLALLILVQVFIFCFSVYVAISLLHERRTGRSVFGDCEMPTLSGVVWIAIGIKMGAVETLLGFFSGSFSLVLARRILLMVSRCCLAFGALRAEGARISGDTGRRRSRTMSQIRAMISNPRTSTFVRLSPTAEEFYSMPRATDTRDEIGAPRPRPQRVTVHYDGRTPPALDVRLSVLDVPPAEVLTATFNKRGTIIADGSYEKWRADSESRKSSRSRSLTRSLSAIAPPPASLAGHPSLPRELQSVVQSKSRATDAMGTITSRRPNPRFSSTEEQRPMSGTSSEVLFPGGHRRFMSSSSSASDSLSIVNNLASQFPGIPPRRTASGRRYSFGDYRNTQTQSTALDNVEEATEKGTIKSGVSPSNSIKRKPPPVLSPGLPGNPAEGRSRADPPHLEKSTSKESNLSQSSSLRRKGVPVPPPIDSSIAGPDASLAQSVSVSNDDTTPATTPHTGRSEHARNYKYSSVRSVSTTGRAPQTPGMTSASGNSTTGPDTDVSTLRDADPFADSEAEAEKSPEEYRIAELAAAESGLNRIASRVAQYDRQRRQSYRGESQPSPVKYSPFETVPRVRRGKKKVAGADGDWNMVEFPSVNEALGVPISRPRRLSAVSSTSSSSLQSATPVSARRVTVAARHGPTYSNATIVPSSAFSDAHAHTTSTGSTKTHVSHTDRELMRIKSIGRVATRRTPTPSSGSFATRQSMRIESVDFSASESTDLESSHSASASPTSYKFDKRHEYESGRSTSMTGLRSVLRQGWTADDDDEADVTDRFRSRRTDSLQQDDA